MELRQYAVVLWRRKLVVLLTAALTVAIVAIGVAQRPPSYAASAVLRLTEGPGAGSYAAQEYTTRLLNTYVYLAESHIFLDQAIQSAGLAGGAQGWGGDVNAEILPDSALIRVSATSANAENAAALVNALAALLAEDGQRLADAAGGPSWGLTVVEPASIPVEPTGPSSSIYLVIAALVGLAGGVGLAFVMENMDSTVRSRDQLERLAGGPLLGAIPAIPAERKRSSGPLLLNGTVRDGAREAFRTLGASALSVVPGGSGQALGSSRVLMIASSEQGAGKSTVAVNLASALAQAGHRVAVVDADLRHPSLHRVFGVENKLGLREVLLASVSTVSALQATKIPGVRVMPSGSSAVGAEMLLNPTRVRQVIRELLEQEDFVVFDSPAVRESADAAALAPLMDGVVLVAAHGRATEAGVDRVLKQMHRVGAKTLGVVLNRARED